MILVFEAAAAGAPGQVLVARLDGDTWDAMMSVAATYAAKCGSFQLDLVTQDRLIELSKDEHFPFNADEAWSTWRDSPVGQPFPDNTPGAASNTFVVGTGVCNVSPPTTEPQQSPTGSNPEPTPTTTVPVGLPLVLTGSDLVPLPTTSTPDTTAEVAIPTSHTELAVTGVNSYTPDFVTSGLLLLVLGVGLVKHRIIVNLLTRLPHRGIQ